MIVARAVRSTIQLHRLVSDGAEDKIMEKRRLLLLHIPVKGRRGKRSSILLPHLTQLIVKVFQTNSNITMINLTMPLDYFTELHIQIAYVLTYS